MFDHQVGQALAVKQDDALRQVLHGIPRLRAERRRSQDECLIAGSSRSYEPLSTVQPVSVQKRYAEGLFSASSRSLQNAYRD